VLTGQLPGSQPRDDAESIVIRRLPTALRLGNAPFTPALFGALRGHDLVHLHWPFIFGAELTAAACWATGTPYVVTYHHDLLASLRWQFGPYQAVVGPLVLRRAARVFPVSADHFAASPLRGHARAPVEIPNGVDADRFAPSVSGAAIRAQLDIPASAVVVGFLGAMDAAHAFKGVPILLEAIARSTRADIRVLAVGGGDLQPAFQAHADELGLGTRAAWPGIVSEEDLPAFIAAMDLLVLPTLGFGAESFGIVLIEAMSCGKPVIASDIPGVRRVVDHGQVGFLVPPGDVGALAARIDQLAGDEALRERLGQAGRMKVEARYQWRSIAGQIDAEYRSVLAAR
jgi:glycosyltransferase involved in cell wall biosynthesis